MSDGASHTDGRVSQSEDETERKECWQCGYERPTFEACPQCGVYGGER